MRKKRRRVEEVLCHERLCGRKEEEWKKCCVMRGSAEEEWKKCCAMRGCAEEKKKCCVMRGSAEEKKKSGRSVVS